MGKEPTTIRKRSGAWVSRRTLRTGLLLAYTVLLSQGAAARHRDITTTKSFPTTATTLPPCATDCGNGNCCPADFPVCDNTDLTCLCDTCVCPNGHICVSPTTTTTSSSTTSTTLICPEVNCGTFCCLLAEPICGEQGCCKTDCHNGGGCCHAVYPICDNTNNT